MAYANDVWPQPLHDVPAIPKVTKDDSIHAPQRCQRGDPFLLGKAWPAALLLLHPEVRREDNNKFVAVAACGMEKVTMARMESVENAKDDNTDFALLSCF